MKNIGFIVLLLILPCIVFAGESPVFTDMDLQKYKRSSDSEVQYQEYETPKITEPEYSVSDERAQRESWCERATKARNRVEKTKRALISASETYIRIKTTYGTRYAGAKAVTEASIEMNKAEAEAIDAENEMKRIEDEAHRKSIPPGWLQCRFE